MGRFPKPPRKWTLLEVSSLVFFCIFSQIINFVILCFIFPLDRSRNEYLGEIYHSPWCWIILSKNRSTTNYFVTVFFENELKIQSCLNDLKYPDSFKKPKISHKNENAKSATLMGSVNFVRTLFKKHQVSTAWLLYLMTIKSIFKSISSSNGRYLYMDFINE